MRIMVDNNTLYYLELGLIIYLWKNWKLTWNGARDLLILNWFEESVAGRQGKGRQLDFRHGRHLDAPGPLSSLFHFTLHRLRQCVQTAADVSFWSYNRSVKNQLSPYWISSGSFSSESFRQSAVPTSSTAPLSPRIVNFFNEGYLQSSVSLMRIISLGFFAILIRK